MDPPYPSTSHRGAEPAEADVVAAKVADVIFVAKHVAGQTDGFTDTAEKLCQLLARRMAPLLMLWKIRLLLLEVCALRMSTMQ